MRPKVITVSPDTADDNGVCTAQSATGANDLNINGALATGGVATFDIPRRVAVSATGDESGVNFTIVGTSRNGFSISEQLTGPNATIVNTENDFATVTQVATSTGTSGNVEVGTNGVFSTQWIPVDHRQNDFQLSFGVVRDGASPSFTYTVQHVFDDIQTEDAQDVTNLNVFDHEFVAGLTNDSEDGNYAFPFSAMRVSVTEWTAGDLMFYWVQGE